MLHLALKAFRLGERKIELPFPLVHIDTGHNYPEVIDFRDQRVAELGARPVVGHVEDSIRRGTVRLRKETDSRNAAQAVTLLETIAEHQFDALMGGARRDEEKARAKERIFSFRDEFGQWDPKAQRPELWSLYNGRMAQGEQMRVFPISNWTELDVWQYIARENTALPRSITRTSAKWCARTACWCRSRRSPQAGRRRQRGAVGALPHGRRHQLHLPGGQHRGHARRDHRRDCGDRDHRARRHPHGRPDQRGVDGAPQEGRLFLSRPFRLPARPTRQDLHHDHPPSHPPRPAALHHRRLGR